MNLKAEKFKAYIAENNITNFKVEIIMKKKMHELLFIHM